MATSVIPSFTCSAGDLQVFVNASTGKYTLGCADSSGAIVGTLGVQSVTISSTGDASSNFSDGVTLGWGVVAAMAAAWAIVALRKGLIR